MDTLRLASRVASQSEDYAESLTLAKEGIQRFPQEPAFYLYASTSTNAIARSGQKSDATNTVLPGDSFLERGISALPNEPDLYWSLINRRLETNQVEEAERLVQRLKTLSFSDALIQFAEGRILAAKGESASAAITLEKARTALIQQDEMVRIIDVSLADVYAAMGNREGQVSALRRVVSPTRYGCPAENDTHWPC